MSHRAFLGLGSNLGDRFCHVQQAIQRIGLLEGTRVVASSPIYETAPLGDYDRDFLNGVLLVETSLEPLQLRRALREIEKELGRAESGPTARTIDIDVLLYDDLIQESEELTLPHRSLCSRRFVLQPLCDLAPDVMINGRTAREWLDELVNGPAVRRLTPRW